MKHVLLVEDDANTAQAVATRLGIDGHQVRAVHSACDAVAAARQGKFDLFILDIGLPDGDGVSLAARLMALPGAQGTPIIFLTGTGDLTSRLQASRLGVCAWVDKPYQPEVLRAAVAAALLDTDPLSRVRRQFSPLKTLVPAPAKGQELKVLVIEDDKRLARALEYRFQSAGYEVIVAHSGTSGLQAAITAHPATIVSDIYMPGGLGFTLLELLASHGLSHIPCIFLTASRRPHLRETALRMGAADFLEKPCDPSELLRSVRRAIYSHN